MQIAASIIFAAIENNYTFQHIFAQRRRRIYAANDLIWRFIQFSPSQYKKIAFSTNCHL